MVLEVEYIEFDRGSKSAARSFTLRVPVLKASFQRVSIIRLTHVYISSNDR